MRHTMDTFHNQRLHCDSDRLWLLQHHLLRFWYRSWLGQHEPCCYTNTRPSFLNIWLSFSSTWPSFWFLKLTIYRDCNVTICLKCVKYVRFLLEIFYELASIKKIRKSLNLLKARGVFFEKNKGFIQITE